MTIKLKTFLFVLSLACSTTLSAQSHFAESKSLVGLWRHVTFSEDGSPLKTDLFKVFNSDGTFCNFRIPEKENKHQPAENETIYLYGVYNITSDSTFTEHVVKNSAVPRMNNSHSELRYKFDPASGNKTLYVMYKNTTLDAWIPEMWERVGLQEERKEAKLYTF